MVSNILLLAAGFFVLIKGAGWLVSGASALAKRYNVSDLAIGLTIVAFGTSAPELVVNAISSTQNLPYLVFGNVIGSNNFNIFVILGIAGLITPLVVQSSTVWKEIPISFLAIVTFYLLANNFFVSSNPYLSRIDGVILLIFFGLFLLYVYKQLKTSGVSTEDTAKGYSTSRIWLLIILGLGGLVLGGQLVVRSATSLATSLGVSQKIIGLTIVAFGTSLPELATSVVAALKKNSDIAVGNIIGSNIFNIFLIFGVSSLIRPMEFSSTFSVDILLLALGTLILFIAMFTGRKKKLDRWEAAILLLIFAGYTVYLVGKEV
ncbi:calcium/sodium antiporter [Perlabentimonas gracilis]|uniref:calcium/sodium antiporter n=1 Tax=Perlabentimonas gracilis TaxID=2715279 RepID=UPI00140BAAC2|nr:calcium/sodium antiporter [Perlabentimonas gracilis]NHB70100.1 calcium/sodium antiporter [Perlabentimonas gracilis]